MAKKKGATGRTLHDPIEDRLDRPISRAFDECARLRRLPSPTSTSALLLTPRWGGQVQGKKCLGQFKTPCSDKPATDPSCISSSFPIFRRRRHRQC